MKSKLLLFIGVILLIAGIVLKKSTELVFLAIALIVIGVSLKAWYIIGKAKSGAYKPGYELGFVALGLALLFTGIYFRGDLPVFHTSFLMGVGIALKIVFVILFVIKVKSLEKSRETL